MHSSAPSVCVCVLEEVAIGQLQKGSFMGNKYTWIYAFCVNHEHDARLEEVWKASQKCIEKVTPCQRSLDGTAIFENHMGIEELISGIHCNRDNTRLLTLSAFA